MEKVDVMDQIAELKNILLNTWGEDKFIDLMLELDVYKLEAMKEIY